MNKASASAETRIQKKQSAVKRNPHRETRKYFTRPAQLMLRLESDDKNVFYSMSAQRSIIGRSLMAPIFIDDDRVSREHAAIDIDRGSYFVVDLGSTNGTWVNEKRVNDPVKVKFGDVIRIGEAIFHVDLKSIKGKVQIKNNATNIMVASKVVPKQKAVKSSMANAANDILKIYKRNRKKLSKMSTVEFEVKKRQFLQWITIIICLVVIIAAMFSTQ